MHETLECSVYPATHSPPTYDLYANTRERKQMDERKCTEQAHHRSPGTCKYTHDEAVMRRFNAECPANPTPP